MAIRLGTRNSPLALAQAIAVQRLLKRAGVLSVICGYSASGDQDLQTPLYKSSSRGVFTKDLEDRLLNGEVDCVVHCLKDLPTTLHPELEIASCLPRDPWGDLLVLRPDIAQSLNGRTLNEILPSLANRALVIGTSSLRRAHWLVSQGLQVANIRGNVQTRVKKLMAGEFDGIVLAEAALTRLKWHDFPAPYWKIPILPAPAQGILALQTRAADTGLKDFLQSLGDPETKRAGDEERRLLSLLQGGCSLPLGALWSSPASLNYSLAIPGQEQACQGVASSARDAFWQIQKHRAPLSQVSICFLRSFPTYPSFESDLIAAGAWVSSRPIQQPLALKTPKITFKKNQWVLVVSPTTAGLIKPLAEAAKAQNVRWVVPGWGTAHALKSAIGIQAELVGDNNLDSLQARLKVEGGPIVMLGPEGMQQIPLAKSVPIYRMVPSSANLAGLSPDDIVVITSPAQAKLWLSAKLTNRLAVFGQKAMAIVSGKCRILAYSDDQETFSWTIWKAITDQDPSRRTFLSELNG